VIDKLCFIYFGDNFKRNKIIALLIGSSINEMVYLQQNWSNKISYPTSKMYKEVFFLPMILENMCLKCLKFVVWVGSNCFEILSTRSMKKPNPIFLKQICQSKRANATNILFIYNLHTYIKFKWFFNVYRLKIVFNMRLLF